jgi:Fe-S oxidoreductase
VREGRKVIAIDPTCSYTLRKEYPELVGTVEAREVAAATRDVCEFLFELKQQGQFCRDFRSSPGKVAYHLPCHLRAQNIGYRSRDLMRLIPGAKITLVEQCSGHDGTWAMKKEFFPLSMLNGKKAFDAMGAASADTLASDCPLASIQFDQALGTRPIHPIQVLARAYRPDGFPLPVEQPIS